MFGLHQQQRLLAQQHRLDGILMAATLRSIAGVSRTLDMICLLHRVCRKHVQRTIKLQLFTSVLADRVHIRGNVRLIVDVIGVPYQK